MGKGSFFILIFILDKIFTNLKEREVKSEERNSGFFNPRRNLSKLNFDQRPLMRVQPESPNKKLYYLQFLSGQPVWGIVKNSRGENMNDTAQILPIQSTVSICLSFIDKQILAKPTIKERLNEKSYFKRKSRPKVNLIKHKKDKLFNNFEEYKHKVFLSAKQATRKQSHQVQLPNAVKQKDHDDFYAPETKIDPLNITFNKQSHGASMKDCPYKNKGSEITNSTSASTNKRSSNKKLRQDVSIDPPNFTTGNRDSKPSKTIIAVDKSNTSKSDLTTPHKTNLLVNDKSYSTELNLVGLATKQNNKVMFMSSQR